MAILLRRAVIGLTGFTLGAFLFVMIAVGAVLA